MGNTKKQPGTTGSQKARKTLLRNALQRKAVRDHVVAVGGIGLPSKMPGTAYGISAALCGVGGKLAEREGTVCHGCYAKKNNYTYPSVMRAHEARYASLSNLQAWVESMSAIFTYLGALLPNEERFHRWHDSGDLQSTEHLGAIVSVAVRNPRWRFWLPTKEYGIVRRFKAQWDIPSNLVVRVSTANRDEAPNAATRSITGLTSTVDANEGHRCPASKQGNECGTCRACWDGSVANVDYKVH